MFSYRTAGLDYEARGLKLDGPRLYYEISDVIVYIFRRKIRNRSANGCSSVCHSTPGKSNSGSSAALFGNVTGLRAETHEYRIGSVDSIPKY